jgi:hypothetical protein
MNYKLVESKKEEIKNLYFNYCKTSIETAIKMGELLTEIKEQVGHGNFDNWVKHNMPFSRMSANNYVRVYKYSLTPEGKINLQKVGLEITDVYKLLIEHKPKEKNGEPMVEKQSEGGGVVSQISVEPPIDTRQEPALQRKEPEPVVEAEVGEKTIDDKLCEGLETKYNHFWVKLTDKNVEKGLDITKKLSGTRASIYTITQWLNDLIENYEEKVI